jgi:hypothetical protein
MAKRSMDMKDVAEAVDKVRFLLLLSFFAV